MPQRPRHVIGSLRHAERRVSPPKARGGTIALTQPQFSEKVVMADQDEDISHLRAPDAGDFDPTEETQDFRLLEKLTCVISHCASLTLFFFAVQPTDTSAIDHKIAHTRPYPSVAKRTLRAMRRTCNSIRSRPRGAPCMACCHGSAHTRKRAMC